MTSDCIPHWDQKTMVSIYTNIFQNVPAVWRAIELKFKTWTNYPLSILLGPILTINWVCFIWHFPLLKRGPKALRRAQKALGVQRAIQPSKGAIRRSTECPKLIFILYYIMLVCYMCAKCFHLNMKCGMWSNISAPLYSVIKWFNWKILAI